MGALPADKEIKAYWSKLSPGQKEVVLQVVKSYIIADEPVISGIGTTFSGYNKELKEAEQAIIEGEFYTHDQIQERIAGWKKKHSR